MDAAASNYKTLNHFLRHGKYGSPVDKVCQKQTALLDELAAATPALEEPLTLWRGFSSLSYVQYLQGWNKSSEVNIRDKAFMSCSLSKSVGNFYARRHALIPEDLEDAVLLRIQVPKGARVICAACCGGLPKEEEILLPRGSVIHIEGLEPRQELSVLTAHATALPEGNVSKSPELCAGCKGDVEPELSFLSLAPARTLPGWIAGWLAGWLRPQHHWLPEILMRAGLRFVWMIYVGLAEG